MTVNHWETILLPDAEPTWNASSDIQRGVRPKRTNSWNRASRDEQLQRYEPHSSIYEFRYEFHEFDEQYELDESHDNGRNEWYEQYEFYERNDAHEHHEQHE